MILSNLYAVGDIVEVNLNPTAGDEKGKTRPCLVVSVHPALKLISVLPITDGTNKKGPAFIPINDFKKAGLSKVSVIDTFQIRTLSTTRISKKMGITTKTEILKCRKNLALIFCIEEEHLS